MNIIKNLTVLLLTTGGLIITLSTQIEAAGSLNLSTEADKALIAGLLSPEKAHKAEGLISFFDIGTRNVAIQSDKISSQIVGNANMSTTATTAEGRFPLSESLELSSHIGAGSINSNDSSYGTNFNESGTIATAGVGVHFKPDNNSPVKVSLAWDHFDININEMFDIPATTDTVNITSIGISYEF